VAASASGAVWFLAQGGDSAVLWRSVHSIAARGFAVLMLLHVVAVSLHLLDLFRD
jgi:cytochrome b561